MVFRARSASPVVIAALLFVSAEEAEQQEIEAWVRHRVPPSYRAIATVEATSLSDADFEREYYHKAQPVLIKNAVLDWPAYSEWTKPNLKRLLVKPAA